MTDPNHWSNLPEPPVASCVLPAQVNLSELGTPPTPEQVWERLTPRERTAYDGIERYANSELSTFKDCRRRWWLTYVLNLRARREEPTGVRQTGDRVHRALEAWYAPQGQPRTDPRDALERVLEADWAVISAALAAEHGEVSADAQKAFQRDADLQRIMVEGYLAWVEETGADADLAVVEPEAYVEVDLPGVENVRLIARLDARVRRVSDGARFWLEHKTVASFQQKLATVHLDEQVLHQTLVERLLPDDGPRVVGALYNLLRRVKRGPTAKPPFYRREEVRHNDRTLESFHVRVVGVLWDLHDVQAQLEASGDPRRVVYPRPSGDCSWKCPFFQVCPMFDDGSRVESALRDLYEVGDPTSYYQRTGEDVNA